MTFTCLLGRCWLGVLLATLTVVTTVAAGASRGGLRYSVLVEKFENHSEEPDLLGEEWATELTTALQESGRFIVVAQSDMQKGALDEQARGVSGVTAQGGRTAPRARMTPAQLLIKGVITHVKRGSANRGGGFGIGGVRITAGRVTSEIRATIQMVDATTSTVVAAKAFVGKAQGRAFGVAVDHAGASAGGGGASDDNLHQAMATAIAEVIPWMTEQLPTVIWRGTVVKIAGADVIINRGSREGVTVGDEFVAGETEVIVDPDSGESIGEQLSERARIRVVSVKERTSTCAVVSGDLRQLVEGMGIQAGKGGA